MVKIIELMMVSMVNNLILWLNRKCGILNYDQSLDNLKYFYCFFKMSDDFDLFRIGWLISSIRFYVVVFKES